VLVEQARSQEPCARGASSGISDATVVAGEVAAAEAAWKRPEWKRIE